MNFNKNIVLQRPAVVSLCLVLILTFSLADNVLSLPGMYSLAANPGKEDRQSSKNFLWKIESLNNTVYLFGSLHLAKADFYPLDSAIEEAFKSSEVLVVEVDTSDIPPQVLQRKFMEKGFYPPGETIKDNISSETFNLLQEKLNELGMNSRKAMVYKPWLLAMTLVTIEIIKLGFSPEAGVDFYFLNKARESGKDIVELESVDYQVNLFESFTSREGELFLFSTLLDMETIEEQMDSMVSAWKNGKAEVLEDILLKGIKEYPRLLPVYKKIFYERNQQMASVIKDFAGKNKDYFVVVGATHLVGKKGIIELLKKEGYFLDQM
ncbi:MAG: hypothetical protein GF375_01455 [Candidatus Omnitrophica bacterium]|nr:hypothetical protein [Candidatus Omnitrophota bacterium]MBD3268797.1 hypothetical protein [Candidatus Omnitrophota bacterium]